MKYTQARATLFLLLADCCVNEAVSFKMNSRMLSMMKMKMRLHSKQEIMANMTAAKATRMVLGMNKTRARPQLVSLIQARLGHTIGLVGKRSAKEVAKTHLRADKQRFTPLEGYEAL